MEEGSSPGLRQVPFVFCKEKDGEEVASEVSMVLVDACVEGC